MPDLILLPFRWKMNPAEFAAVRGDVVVLLRFVAIYALFDGMAVIFGSAIRGAGDTRFAMAYSVITGWLLMVLPAYVLKTQFGAGLISVWSCVTLFIVTLGLGFLWRFRTGRWKTMRRDRGGGSGAGVRRIGDGKCLAIGRDHVDFCIQHHNFARNVPR